MSQQALNNAKELVAREKLDFGLDGDLPRWWYENNPYKSRLIDALGSQHARHVRKDCAALILWTAEKATWMAGEGIQIFGGNGYINDYPLGRLWRDAKLYEIGAGTSEIRRMLIGRELFNATS